MRRLNSGVICAIAVAVALLLTGHPDRAAATEADLCRAAAVEAAARRGVPERFMLAITLVETRRKSDGAVGPWPWTVNVAGKGYWFDSRAEALAHARATLAAGQVSFDVGCFQLNYRWHGSAFDDIAEMFDPALSADYAAQFLLDLYRESGDWLRAAGHYHSRTPRHSARYRRLVAAALDHPALAEGIGAVAPAGPLTAPVRRHAARLPDGATLPLLAAAAGPLIAGGSPVPGSGSGAGGSAGAVGLGALAAGRPLFGTGN